MNSATILSPRKKRAQSDPNAVFREFQTERKKTVLRHQSCSAAAERCAPNVLSVKKRRHSRLFLQWIPWSALEASQSVAKNENPTPEQLHNVCKFATQEGALEPAKKLLRKSHDG